LAITTAARAVWSGKLAFGVEVVLEAALEAVLKAVWSVGAFLTFSTSHFHFGVSRAFFVASSRLSWTFFFIFFENDGSDSEAISRFVSSHAASAGLSR